MPTHRRSTTPAPRGRRRRGRCAGATTAGTPCSTGALLPSCSRRARQQAQPPPPANRSLPPQAGQAAAQLGAPQALRPLQAAARAGGRRARADPHHRRGGRGGHPRGAPPQAHRAASCGLQQHRGARGAGAGRAGDHRARWAAGGGCWGGRQRAGGPVGAHRPGPRWRVSAAARAPVETRRPRACCRLQQPQRGGGGTDDDADAGAAGGRGAGGVRRARHRRARRQRAARQAAGHHRAGQLGQVPGGGGWGHGHEGAPGAVPGAGATRGLLPAQPAALPGCAE
jgi:hypothetical protein